MIHLNQTCRIHAGNNGVYDAVFSEDSAAWFIRYLPWQALRYREIDNDQAEYSTDAYDSAYAAKLAWERQEIRYTVLSSPAGHASQPDMGQ